MSNHPYWTPCSYLSRYTVVIRPSHLVYFTTFWKQSLDPILVLRTCLNLPRWRRVEDQSALLTSTQDAHLYDPVFLMLLFSHMLAEHGVTNTLCLTTRSSASTWTTKRSRRTSTARGLTSETARARSMPSSSMSTSECRSFTWAISCGQPSWMRRWSRTWSGCWSLWIIKKWIESWIRKAWSLLMQQRVRGLGRSFGIFIEIWTRTSGAALPSVDIKWPYSILQLTSPLSPICQSRSSAI